MFAFVIAADLTVTLFADCVNLIYKNYTRRFFVRLFKEVTHLCRTSADKHFHKFRSRNRKKRNLCLTGNRFCEQSLTRSRRADKQRAFRQLCTYFTILFGRMQKIDYLGQQVLCLVLTGNIRKANACR